MNILEEIMKNASEIPLECQLKIRDVTTAMVFTKNVILKEHINMTDASKDQTDHAQRLFHNDPHLCSIL